MYFEGLDASYNWKVEKDRMYRFLQERQRSCLDRSFSMRVFEGLQSAILGIESLEMPVIEDQTITTLETRNMHEKRVAE